MPFHIPWQTSPGHTIYHAMSARPYHIPCDARQAIAYTMPWPLGHTIYHAVPTRPYHTPFLARQAIPYTMPCPPGHTIHHCLPARPYHILCQAPCLACQAITIYHAMPARPYHKPRYAHQTMSYTTPCTPGHTIYHCMPARPYHIEFYAHQAIPYTICDDCQALPYTMLCPQCHAMHARPCHMPCHARQAISYTMQKFQIHRLLICPWCDSFILHWTKTQRDRCNYHLQILVEISLAGAFLLRFFLGWVNMKNSNLDALFCQI